MNSSFTFPGAGPSDPLRHQSSRQGALICFSHLRWDFVFQRPQHLLSQAAQAFRVYYIEEPEFAPVAPHFRMRVVDPGITVLTPVFDEHTDHVHEQHQLVRSLQRALSDCPQVFWYNTPMALRFTKGLHYDLTVYDCMDELAAFRFAPPELVELERDLLSQADLVFTGGASLYAAKRGLHPDVHCFPSSVDAGHFGRARGRLADPSDQAAIPHPRIGFFGVIDERMDLGLVAQAAAGLPDVQFVMLGPVAKLHPGDLPQAPNLHWLGRKAYDALPAYMANWQAAWMPFALNKATQFISPTKTPEFLAAGLRVTATAVADVVATYGRQGLVTIADAGSILPALADSLTPPAPGWQAAVDRSLGAMSWRVTWNAMQSLMLARLRSTVTV